MRTKQYDSTYPYQIYLDNLDTNASSLIRNDTYVKRTTSISRSGVIKRPSTSFRQPTPYETDVSIKRPPVGTSTVKAVSPYPWNPTTQYRYEGHAPIFEWDNFDTTGFYQHPLEEAILKAYSNLNDSKLNLAITLAEASQTWSMISSRAMQIYQFYRALRRGKMKDAAHALGMSSKGFVNVSKDASSRFLEYQFGWLQLLSDINNGVLESVRWYQGPLPRYTGRGVVRIPNHKYTTRDQPSSYQVPGSRQTHLTQGYDLALVRLDYEVGSWETAVANRLGLINPLQVAWDMVPYSFVIDWFLPVNSWLNSFTADAGLRFLGGSYSLVTKINHSMVNIEPLDSNTQLQSNWDITLPSEERLFFRRGQYSAPPRVWFPPLKVPGSLGQALTATALLLQRLK